MRYKGWPSSGEMSCIPNSSLSYQAYSPIQLSKPTLLPLLSLKKWTPTPTSPLSSSLPRRPPFTSQKTEPLPELAEEEDAPLLKALKSTLISERAYRTGLLVLGGR